LRQSGFILNLDGMRYRDCLSRFMIDAGSQILRQEVRDVLDKGSGAIHVQALEAVADAEDGFAQMIGVL